VLHAHHDALVGDERPAGLRSGGDGEELLDLPAPLPVDGDAVQRVVRADGAAGPVGRDPQVPVLVERQVVGARDRRDLALVEPCEVGGRVRRVAAHEQQPPRERRGRVVVAGVDELEDLAELVEGARVGLVDLRGRARGVVRQRRVHHAGLRAGLDVLGTVHLGCAGGVGRLAGEDEGLLAAHAGDV
jgi:hypothetical protein